MISIMETSKESFSEVAMCNLYLGFSPVDTGKKVKLLSPYTMVCQQVNCEGSCRQQ